MNNVTEILNESDKRFHSEKRKSPLMIQKVACQPLHHAIFLRHLKSATGTASQN